MDIDSKLRCQGVSIEIDEGVSFGFPRPREILIEAPANIRHGIYDIDAIGAFTYLGGRETFVRHVGHVGRFCSIASNIVAGQVEHPTGFLSAHPLFQGAFEWRQLADYRGRNEYLIHKAQYDAKAALARRIAKITIGNDVWIGEGVFIRRGVAIGDGAIVASRAVVTQDVAPYSIVGGIPAKPIRMRFSEEIIAELHRLAWWHYGVSALYDVDIADIESALATIDHNIRSGRAEPYAPMIARIAEDKTATLCKYDAAQGVLYAV